MSGTERDSGAASTGSSVEPADADPDETAPSTTGSGQSDDPPTETPEPNEGPDSGEADSSGDTEEPPEESDDGPSPDSPLPAGAECTEADDCASDHCVDGVCCSTACDALCSTCSAAGSVGTCSALDLDPSCPTLQCPPDSECRTYQNTTPAGACSGLGVCVAEATCSTANVASGEPCQSGTGTCNGQGECLVEGKAPLGESCSVADDCASGSCSDDTTGTPLCCESACTDVCRACDEDGYCTGHPADDARCEAFTCPADSACTTYPDPPTSERCIGAGQCATEATYCLPEHAEAGTGCGSGLECDGSGACTSVCEGTETWCTDSCADLQNDEQHCGTCTDSCPATAQCVGGDCDCPDAESICADECVDTSTDPNNCGECGTTCSGGAHCVQGDCKSWGTVTKIADLPDYEGSTLDVAIDASGNVFVAYMAKATNTTFAVKRRPSGGSWSAAKDLDSTTNRGNFYTKGKVGVDADGNALAIWGSNDGYGYSRYRNGAWSGSASYVTVADQDVPRLAMSGTGDAYIASDNQIASAGTEVWFRRYSGGANAWSTAIQMDSTEEASCLGAIGADPGGDGLIVYSEDAEVYARWWDFDAQQWRGAAQPLNEGYCFVSVAFDGAGRSVVAAAGSDNIYGSVSTGNNTWDTEPLAAPGEPFSYRSQETRFAGSGGDAIVALETVADLTGIDVAVWSAATESWQGISPLMPATASKEYNGVSLGLDSVGNGFVVSAIYEDGGIAARRRSGATAEWEAEFVVGPLQGPAGTTNAQPRIVMNASGNAMVVWMESGDEGERALWSRAYE